MTRSNMEHPHECSTCLHPLGNGLIHCCRCPTLPGWPGWVWDQLPHDVLPIPRGFRTPASDYPKQTVGTARLVHIQMPPGRYWMNGLYGPWQYVETEEPIPVTHLQTLNRDGEWQTWMVDDPTHWLGLQVYAKRIRGPEVFVGGLGLGLILHLLKGRRQDIHRIICCEKNQDVIDLISPMLGWNLDTDPLLIIVNTDAWEHLEYETRVRHLEYETRVRLRTYNTIFLDLWRGPISGQIPEVIEKTRMVHAWHPGADLLCFWFSELVDRDLTAHTSLEAIR